MLPLGQTCSQGLHKGGHPLNLGMCLRVRVAQVGDRGDMSKAHPREKPRGASCALLGLGFPRELIQNHEFILQLGFINLFLLGFDFVEILLFTVGGSDV